MPSLPVLNTEKDLYGLYRKVPRVYVDATVKLASLGGVVTYV